MTTTPTTAKRQVGGENEKKRERRTSSNRHPTYKLVPVTTHVSIASRKPRLTLSYLATLMGRKDDSIFRNLDISLPISSKAIGVRCGQITRFRPKHSNTVFFHEAIHPSPPQELPPPTQQGQRSADPATPPNIKHHHRARATIFARSLCEIDAPCFSRSSPSNDLS